MTTPATSAVPQSSQPLAIPPPAVAGSSGTGANTAPPASPPASPTPGKTGPTTTIITPTGQPGNPPAGNDATLNQINHFVVIYQENWSFDSLYGNFPGANGIANTFDQNGNFLNTQVDRSTGQPISSSGPTFNPAYSYDPSPLNNPPQPLDASYKPDPQLPRGPEHAPAVQAVDLHLSV